MISKLTNTFSRIKNIINDPFGSLKTLWQKILDLKAQILKAVILAVLIFIVSYFFSWWSGAVVCFFFMAYKKEITPKEAFTMGTIAGITVWAGYAGYLHFANEGIITGKISELVSKGTLDAGNILQITGVLGGLICGLGAMTGAYAREWAYDTRIQFGWKW